MIVYCKKTSIEKPAIALDVAKKFIRIDAATEDDLVSSLILSAQAELGAMLSTAILSTEFTCLISPANTAFKQVAFPLRYIRSVISVETQTIMTGVREPIKPDGYYFNDMISDRPILYFKREQFSDDKMKDMIIKTMVGLFGLQADVSALVKVQLLQRIAQLYQHRGDDKDGIPELVLNPALRSHRMIAELRKKVEFQKPLVIQDSAGGNLVDWQAQGYAWASVKPISGDQYEPQESQLVTGQQTWEVKVRYADMPLVATSWRIVYKTKLLYVNGVYNQDERDKYLIMHCRSD